MNKKLVLTGLAFLCLLTFGCMKAPLSLNNYKEQLGTGEYLIAYVAFDEWGPIEYKATSPLLKKLENLEKPMLFQTAKGDTISILPREDTTLNMQYAPDVRKYQEKYDQLFITKEGYSFTAAILANPDYG